jgi:RimJ/RimL family protein N-acetyltransferase
VFSTFEVDHVIHCINPENPASQAVARRLGAAIERQAQMSGDTVDIWVTRRNAWFRQN